MISWEDFEKVELRIGTIIEAHEFPEARKPAYKLKVDFGPEVGVRKSSAQITDLYDPETLIGKQVLAVTNFPPKQIGSFMSECLVTGIRTEEGSITLVGTDHKVSNGQRLI
ncbi:tRNA-binding protein [Marinobacter sp. TBZ242]|uniref:tRNA-binding protein n=1 Tax=Marinobacter azerbaijanicus TaxID=3050455 RepID=A0ABT7IE62_9GAMM|nr:tRNA-binding protein [Marinobacter sp. TBZ242]MDL0432451.1 tRNA-binding protein [Marinobacter sp. TBZ242]